MVRRATRKDLKELSVLFDAYRVFYEQATDLVAAADFLADRFDKGDSEIFVIDRDGDGIVGFVQLYPLYSSVRMKKLWLLNDLFVDPRFRGKGLSMMLIDRSKHLAEESGAAGLILETAKSNHVGSNLYPKAGFVRDNDHDYYSWDRE